LDRSFNTDGQLASGERCLEAHGGHVQVKVCPTKPSGDWEYMEDTHQMRDKLSGKCAAKPSGGDNAIDMQTCDTSKKSQKFIFIQKKAF